MPNKNYVRGRAKEYRIATRLRNEGYTVLRMAGSHGFCDLIAITHNHIRFIQVKPDKYTTSNTNKLLKENEWVNKTRQCTFEVL